MRLELEEISTGGVVREYEVPVETFPGLRAIADAEEFEFTSSLVFRLRLQRVGTLVELDGDLAVSIKEVCGRCLSPFVAEIESSFALTFAPRKEHPPEQEMEEVELEGQELGLIFYDEDQLELLDPLQEQVIVSLPISPLCKEECLGLCAECGVNLNETKCTCEKKLFNSKFAGLKNLKIDS